MSGDGLRLCQLRRRDVAQTDMTNQPLALAVREHRQRLFNRTLRGPSTPAYPKIDDIERVDGRDFSGCRERRRSAPDAKEQGSRTCRAATRAHFRDNHEFLRDTDGAPA